MLNRDCKDGSKPVTDAAEDGIESDSADDAESEEGLNIYDIATEALIKSRKASKYSGYDSAIEILDKAIKILCELGGDGPCEAADLCIERAIVHGYKNESDLELAALTKVIELRGFDWDYQKRAHFYERAGDYDKALADYTTALDREESSESYLLRGAVFFKKKDYDSAISDFLNSVKCCSWCGEMPNDLHGPKRRLFRKDNGKRCGECLESFYMCGLSYHKKGDLKSAIKYLNKALWRDSDFEKAKALKEVILAEEKR